MAVPIHVRQRHGHAPGAGGEAGLCRPLGEHAVAVVQEQHHAAAERADEQVQGAVPIHVGEHGTRRVPPRHRHAGPGRDILEAPVAQIAI